MTFDQVQKCGAMTLHAKRIGERQGDAASASVRDARPLDGRPLAPTARRRDNPRDRRRFADAISSRVDIGGREVSAGAEKRVHRSLRIGRHEDQAARGRRPVALPAACETRHRPAVISWRNAAPSSSSRILPMKPVRPPSAAMPAIVFAAEPPEAVTVEPMAA